MSIMSALREQPALRAAIVSFTTGTKERVALKKSWESCGEDIGIALEEGETNAASVLAPFDLDDRVRFLDAKQLWTYVTEGDFWKGAASASREIDMVRSHIAFMLDRALEDRLVSHQDIVDGISVDELAARLPKSELGNIIKMSLNNSRKETAFTEKDLLAAVPPSVLVNYVPLVHLWNSVIVQTVAERHGYVEPPKAAPKASEEGAAAAVAEKPPASAPEAAAPLAEAAPGSKVGDVAAAEKGNAAVKPASGALPPMPAPAPVADAAGAPPVSVAPPKPGTRRANAKAAALRPAGSRSEVGFKVPAPASGNGDSTIDTSTWSAEIGENDLLEEDTVAEDDILVGVVNS
jgi:hypothetical protein